MASCISFICGFNYDPSFYVIQQAITGLLIPPALPKALYDDT